MENAPRQFDLCAGAHAELHARKVPRRDDDRKRARRRRRRRGARRLDLLGIDGLRGPRRRNIDLVNLRLRRLDHLSLNGPGLGQRHHELGSRVNACRNHYSQVLARWSTDIELRARSDSRRYGHRKMAFHGSECASYGAVRGYGAVPAAAIYGAVRGYYTGPCSVRGYTGPFSVACLFTAVGTAGGQL